MDIFAEREHLAKLVKVVVKGTRKPDVGINII